MLSESTPCAPKAQIRSASRLPIPPPTLKYRVWITRTKAACSTLIAYTNCMETAESRFDYWSRQPGGKVTMSVYSESVRRYVVTCVAENRIEERWAITDKGRAALAQCPPTGAGDWEGD